VHVFVYDELVKAEYKFEEDPTDGSYAPVQIWGAGTGYADNGKGRIEKTSEMFKIGYTTRIGTDESIELNDDGWIDINKTRKPLSFDFSNIANGSFSETIDGGSEATYKVGFDNDGRITRITDENGHITEVHW
jgi:YD repeat-containing protein